MTQLTQLPARLIELKDRAKSRPDFHAETGSPLHVDLYEYILAHQDKGSGVIEIGCYKGASSIVLAYACQELQMPFFTLDINNIYLDYTRNLLLDLDLAQHTTFFLGSMPQFAETMALPDNPILVFVDGDHSYSGVLTDIRAIYRLKRRPYAIAFHDFSLRSFKYTNIAVDKAVYDAFGANAPLRRIGVQFGEHPTPSRENPSPSGSYWDYQGSEAVIVETGHFASLHL
jgi:predicted O-methyltransferase YrrM